MPLRYKKLAILFSLGIMLIGFGTFSMVAPGFEFSFGGKKEENISAAATFGAIKPVEGKTQSEIQTEIEELMKRYFTAKQQVDMDMIGQCVSDIAYVEEKKLLAESEYVESYENIQCMVLDGASEGAYRVYVYYDVKIYDIETLIPSLNVLYVNLNEEGNLQIYFGTLDANEQKCIDELDQCKEVQELISTVSKKMEEVISSDEQVREFYEMLESVNNTSSQTENNENIQQEAQGEAAAE